MGCVTSYHERLKHSFSTRVFLCDLLKIVLALALVVLCLVLLALWKDCLGAWIRPISLDHIAAILSPLIAATSWPIFILFVIYIFKDVLPEAIEAVVDILRAWNGLDAVKPAQTSIENKKIETKSDAVAALQELLGKPIYRDVQLFNMDVRFDGVYNDARRWTAIEVKLKDISGLKEHIYSISSAYMKLKHRDQRHFALLLFVPETKFASTDQWRCEFDFKIHIATQLPSGKVIVK